MKSLFYLLGFLFLFRVAQASERIVYYFGSNDRPVETLEEAKYMKSVSAKGKRMWIIKSYEKIDGAWQLEEIHKIKNISEELQLIRIKKSLLFSTRIHRYYNKSDTELYEFRELIGKQEVRKGSAASLIPLHLEGEVHTNYLDGQLKSVAHYKNNQLQSNINWLPDGTEYYENIFYSVDKEPEYSLGFGNFRNHVLAGVIESGYGIAEVDEEIILGWVIMEDGTLKGVHKVSGKLEVLSGIIIKQIEALPGHWNPAVLNGQQVRFYMTVPFRFTKQNEYFDNIELRDGVLIWD